MGQYALALLAIPRSRHNSLGRGNSFCRPAWQLSFFVLFMAGVAYFIMTKAIIYRASDKLGFVFSHSSQTQGIVFCHCLWTGNPDGFFLPIVSVFIIVLIAILWLVPDPAN